MRTVLRLGLPWLREGQAENNGVAGHLVTTASKCLGGNSNVNRQFPEAFPIFNEAMS